MNLGEAMKNEANWSVTENGAEALVSTGSNLLDFYGSLGNYRNESLFRKTADFDAAFAEDALLATKLLFYCRDARGGLGERKTFREILRHCADVHTDAVVKNIPLIGYFGRFDDLYALVGTKAEDEMWSFMKDQFEQDVQNMNDGKPCSLLAKWIKTPDASLESTRELGKLTAKKLGYGRNKMKYFKKNLKALRKYLDIVETKIYQGNYSDIDYSKMPGKALLRYKKLIETKDTKRYNAYLESVSKGEAKMNTSVVTPYDVVSKYFIRNYSIVDDLDKTVEEMWKNLPDYVDKKDMKNNLVVCDTSGSMYGDNAILVALSLAIYAAERNVGMFKDSFITFSSRPQLQKLEGDTLLQKMHNLACADWGMSTDIEAVMDLILKTAIKYKIPASDMPVAITIVSDMQFNSCMKGQKTYIQHFKQKFREAGYELPNVIFWNVRNSKSVFHTDKDENGVQLASGCNASVFANVAKAMNMSPYEAMLKILSNPRYDVIQV